MIVELLERAVRFFRLGQNAFGSTSWQAFLAHADRKGDHFFDEVAAAIHVGDYLRIADVIEFKIKPLYQP